MKRKIAFGLVFLLASVAAIAGGDGESAPAVVQEPAQDSFAARSLSSEDLAGLIGQPDLYLLDVRTAEEYKAGAIPSALNIPYDVIQDHLPTQDRSARIVVYCRSGSRAGMAKSTLEELGFRNVNNFGSVGNWKGQLVVR